MAYTPQKFSADLAAATLTDLITGGAGLPTGTAGTYLLAFTNRTGVATTVRWAVTTGGAAGVGEYLVYDAPLTANGVIRDWPIPLFDGWKVWVYSAAASVSATLIGLEN